MNLLDIYDFMGKNLQKITIADVLKTNEVSNKYGLVLTAAQAQALIEARNQAILSHGRVELGIEVIKKIIAAFCTSSYINSEDYAFILNELVEIFYYMKNETEDTIGDDELISIMQEFFNHSCQGSLELLKNRELALWARISRRRF